MEHLKEFHGKIFDLIRKDGLMIYSYRPGKIVDYLTDNDLLFRILTTYGVSPFIWDGRIRFQLQANNDHSTYRIHDLAFACYHGLITSFDTWQAEMQQFLDRKRFHGLTMDHADSNGHNNTGYNLSLMPGSLNGAKADIVSRFRVPVYLTSSFVDSKYRLRVVWDTVQTNAGAGDASMYLLCQDAEGYVDCLRSLSRVEPEWYQSLRDGKGWKKNGNPCAFSDIGKSVAAQITLARMDEQRFDPYHIGGLKESLVISSVERLILRERVNTFHLRPR